jgi:hypothetical protein
MTSMERKKDFNYKITNVSLDMGLGIHFSFFNQG